MVAKLALFVLPVFQFQNRTRTRTAAMVTSCSGIISDHTTLLGMTDPALPLIGYILAFKQCANVETKNIM